MFKKILTTVYLWWTGWKQYDYLVYDPQTGRITSWRIIGCEGDADGARWEWEQVRRGFFRAKKIEAPVFFASAIQYHRYVDVIAKRVGGCAHPIFRQDRAAMPPLDGWVCKLG